jgi:putative transposase
MPKSEQIPIQRSLSYGELSRRIRELERETKLLDRLRFIKYRYDGVSVDEAARRVGVAKCVGYDWQRRWNESGYDGLFPRYAGGRPSKLTPEQKEQLKSLVAQKELWTTHEVRELILREFGVAYTLKQIRIMLRELGTRYGRPQVYASSKTGGYGQWQPVT